MTGTARFRRKSQLHGDGRFGDPTATSTSPGEARELREVVVHLWKERSGTFCFCMEKKTCFIMSLKPSSHLL